jgi:hypothetical protein
MHVDVLSLSCKDAKPGKTRNCGLSAEAHPLPSPFSFLAIVSPFGSSVWSWWPALQPEWLRSLQFSAFISHWTRPWSWFALWLGTGIRMSLVLSKGAPPQNAKKAFLRAGNRMAQITSTPLADRHPHKLQFREVPSSSPQLFTPLLSPTELRTIASCKLATQCQDFTLNSAVMLNRAPKLSVSDRRNTHGPPQCP